MKKITGIFSSIIHRSTLQKSLFFSMLTLSISMAIVLSSPKLRSKIHHHISNLHSEETELVPSSIPGEYFEVDVPPEAIDTYLDAKFRLWIPDTSQNLRGILVRQHGCSQNGIHYSTEPKWQEFAQQHNLALLSSNFMTGDKPCEYWALTNYGSERAFFKALDQLSLDSKHLELKDLPWILWGFSGGADWAAQIFQQFPDRTIALVMLRGGAFLFFGVNPHLTKTPVMFFLGAEDDCFEECVELPKKVFTKYRTKDAAWSLAIEPESGHSLGNSASLVIPYLHKILLQRLPVDGYALTPINKADGWLGDADKLEIFPYGNQAQSSSSNTSWFPDRDIAELWLEHIQTN